MTKVKKRRRIRFSRIIKLYCAVLLATLAVGAVLLLIYLGVYERHLPSNVAKEAAESYASEETLAAFLTANSEKISFNADATHIDPSYVNTGKGIIDSSELISSLRSSYIPLTAGKKIAFISDSRNFSEESPAYNITADGVKVAHLSLKEAGKAAFGTTRWELDAITLINPGSDYKLAESSAMNSEFPASESNPSGVSESSDDISAAASDPGASTLTGNLPATVNAGGWTFAYSGRADDAFIDKTRPYVEDALRAWALYFVYMDHSLSSYMLPGTDVYAYIFGSESVYQLDPSLYNYEYIESWDFPMIETDDYTFYSDECFTVEVRYKLDLTFSIEELHDDNQKLDATWVWVLSDGEWKLADCIYH